MWVLAAPANSSADVKDSSKGTLIMRASTIGIAICFAVIVSTWGCTGTHGVGSDDGGTTSSDSSSGGGSGFPSDAGAGPLYLLATGGVSLGEVAAGVALVELGVGQHQTCTGPLDAGACQLTSCTVGGVGSPNARVRQFRPIPASVGTTTELLTYNFVGYRVLIFPSSITLGTWRHDDVPRRETGPASPSSMFPQQFRGLAVIASPVPTTDVVVPRSSTRPKICP